MFKKYKVVMLSTNKKAAPILSYLDNKSIQYFPNEYWSNSDLSKRHLYITSDEEIKEDDWYIHNQKNIGLRVQKHNGFILSMDAKKIIASTDTSLITIGLDSFSGKPNTLPKISQQFIKKYIEEYNKNNIITEVLVEYEEYKISKTEWFQEAPYICKYDSTRLKVNPKDNTITIKKVKDSWSREEYIANIKSFAKEFVANTNTAYKQADINKWIEKNL